MMGFLTSKDREEIEKNFTSELKENERRVLRKLHPFRFDRNSLLVDFYRRGVSVPLLAKISGLSHPHINRLVKGSREKNLCRDFREI